MPHPPPTPLTLEDGQERLLSLSRRLVGDLNRLKGALTELDQSLTAVRDQVTMPERHPVANDDLP